VSSEELPYPECASARDPALAWEAELIRRAADGDGEAIGAIYDRYALSLHRVLTAILGSSVDSEDALQEIFVKLVHGRGRRIRDLRAYLFTAARHEAYSMLRRRWRERPLEDTDLYSAVAPPTDEVHWQALLHRLPPEQREVIAMKVYEEMTFAEIAAIVHASANTVASRYRYGIARLRAWVREENEDENGS
jgi:RNA polymerase sigma-70 factor (ECF subfamily)